MTATTYYLSIDIEARGSLLNNPVNAIGACFGPADGSWPREKLIRFRGNLKPLPGQQDEEDCMREFWAKHPDVLREIDDAAEDPVQVVTRFLAYCQELVATYEDGPTPGEIVLVTDCPDFDLGRLLYLCTECTKVWSTPIRALGKPGSYHSQIDPGERKAALKCKKECDAWIKATVPGVVADHRPDNDAEHVYYEAVYLNLRATGLLQA